MQDFRLRNVIMKRLYIIKKCIVAEQILKHIRNKSWAKALKNILSYPGFILFFSRRIHYALYIKYVARMGKVKNINFDV
jgi:hypothetical protein